MVFDLRHPPIFLLDNPGKCIGYERPPVYKLPLPHADTSYQVGVSRGGNQKGQEGGGKKPGAHARRCEVGVGGAASGGQALQLHVGVEVEEGAVLGWGARVGSAGALQVVDDLHPHSARSDAGRRAALHRISGQDPHYGRRVVLRVVRSKAAVGDQGRVGFQPREAAWTGPEIEDLAARIVAAATKMGAALGS